MMVFASMIVLALLSGDVTVSQERAKVPKDSVQLTVTGCLKGRVLTADGAPEVEEGELDVPVHRFQISGRKPLLKDVRRHDGERIEIIGLVRKLDLKEPGFRVPGGRVLITPGQAHEPHHLPTRPADRVILLEVLEFRALGRECND